MPSEGLVSAVCEAFGCTPSQALREEPGLVIAVMEYRLAQSAKAQHREDATKMTDGQAEMMAALARLLEERQADG